MGMIGDALQKKIDNYNNVKYGDTIAVITKYDRKTNRCSVIFTDPNSGTRMSANNVAFSTMPSGFMPPSPRLMQKCWISFLSGNLLTPVITSLCDDEFSKNTYNTMSDANAGGYLCSDKVLNTIPEKIEIKPHCESYFTDKPYTVEASYEDPYEDIMDSIISMDKYSDKEGGFTINGTTVKVKEDGTISLFVDNNSGVQISPDGFVDVYGRLRVNGEEYHGS